MLSNEMAKMLNSQLTQESNASNAYLAMASWCFKENLPGIGEFFYNNADDERNHMLEMFKYINENGGYAAPPAVGDSKLEYSSLLEVFETMYTLEANNTKHINKLADMAMAEKDYATFKFLEPFIAEQQDSEKSVLELIHMVKVLGTDARNLYFINRSIKKMIDKAASASQN